MFTVISPLRIFFLSFFLLSIQNIVRPMTVFSGSFAERGSSAKQRALLEAKDEFVSAMSELEGCIKDRKGEGFFAPDIKMPTGSERTQQVSDLLKSHLRFFHQTCVLFHVAG